jgi:uncharacterized Zn-binding protein involved in type VI secretion
MGLVTRFFGPNRKGSELTIKEMDDNLYYLQSIGVVDINFSNGDLILTNPTGGTITTKIDSYNKNFIPFGEEFTVPNGYQNFVYGDVIVEGTLNLEDDGELVVLNGDIIISGGTIIGSGNTYSITLPEFNTFVTNGQFNSTTKKITFTGNFGFTPFDVDLSSLSTDNFYTTGGTYNSLTESIDFNGNSSATTFSVDLSLLKFTGNTQSECISDIYVSNIRSCSPLYINPNDEGDIIFGSNSGVTIDTNSNITVKGFLKASNFSGTTNYIPKFSPNTYSVGNSVITNNSNNVSIGTISTPYRFYVLGVNSTANQPLFVVRDTGRVGINTTTPNAELTIQNTKPETSQDIVTLRNNGTGVNTGNAIRFINSTNASSTVGSKIESIITNLSGRNSINFYTHGGGGIYGGLQQRMSIDGTGKVTAREFNSDIVSATTYLNLPVSNFTGNTSADCITDLYVTNLNSCSPLHIQPTNNGDVYISESGGFVGIGTNNPITTLDVNGNVNISNSLSATTFYGDGSNLSGVSSDNFYTTGGTYNSLTESIDFNGNSSATTFSVDVSQLLDDTNTYTTGATLNGNVIEFNRNDLSNAYSVDLSSLNTSVNYGNVAFVDNVNGSDISGTINDFTKPFKTITSAQSALVSSGQTNYGLIYVRKGTYVNLTLNLVTGIDVYCEPGVLITGTVIIRDNGVAVECNFLGYARIVNFSAVEVFRITADSFVRFEFDYIYSNGAALSINSPTTSNQTIIKGNLISAETLGFGYAITIRDASNVIMDITNKIESQHISIFTRRLAGNVIINAKKIVLKEGNLYGGNSKQTCWFGNSTSNPGKITINADLVNEDTVYYGGISSMVRFWESPNLNVEINGNIFGGVTLGVVMSNGASKMKINGDVTSNVTAVFVDGSNTLTIINSNINSNTTVINGSGSSNINLKNCTLIRSTDTFSSPFSVSSSSTVYVNDSTYYSEFFGNMINIESNNAKLYLKNFTAEGFIDLTGTTGSFINNGSANPTVGLINVTSNRDNNINLVPTYSNWFTVEPNLSVPKFF